MAIYELRGGSSETALPIAISDVTDLANQLAGKAVSNHTHVISDVTDLQNVLDNLRKPSLPIATKEYTIGTGGTYSQLSEIYNNALADKFITNIVIRIVGAMPPQNHYVNSFREMNIIIRNDLPLDGQATITLKHNLFNPVALSHFNYALSHLDINNIFIDGGNGGIIFLPENSTQTDPTNAGWMLAFYSCKSVVFNNVQFHNGKNPLCFSNVGNIGFDGSISFSYIKQTAIYMDNVYAVDGRFSLNSLNFADCVGTGVFLTHCSLTIYIADSINVYYNNNNPRNNFTLFDVQASKLGFSTPPTNDPYGINVSNARLAHLNGSLLSINNIIVKCTDCNEEPNIVLYGSSLLKIYRELILDYCTNNISGYDPLHDFYIHELSLISLTTLTVRNLGCGGNRAPRISATNGSQAVIYQVVP